MCLIFSVGGWCGDCIVLLRFSQPYERVPSLALGKTPPLLLTALTRQFRLTVSFIISMTYFKFLKQ